MTEQNQSTATVPEQTTQPQAATVDMEAINKAAEARAERAAQGVVRDMLKQHGLDDDAVKLMLNEWKAKQTTPEQTIAELRQQLDAERQEKTALAKGVPLGSDDEVTKSRVTACMTLAKSYVSEDTTFEAALDKALSVISFEPPKTESQTPPPMWGGAGRTATSTMDAEKERIMTAAKAAMKIK